MNDVPGARPTRPDLPLAVVIGAGGMGMAVGRRLCQRHRILLVDIDEERATAGAQALQREGGDATALACDITDAAAVRNLAARVEALGGFQALVQVAALSPSMGDFHTLVRVNLLGAVAVATALLPLANVGAAAVQISSMAPHLFQPPEAVAELLHAPPGPDFPDRLAEALDAAEATPQLAYTLSKRALMAYCRREAAAWGERGARIVSLSPGMIATPMGAREFAASPAKARMFAKSPLKREGTMLEIADAVEFLVSDRASFISGTDLLVDGGLSAALTTG